MVESCKLPSKPHSASQKAPQHPLWALRVSQEENVLASSCIVCCLSSLWIWGRGELELDKAPRVEV